MKTVDSICDLLLRNTPSLPIIRSFRNRLTRDEIDDAIADSLQASLKMIAKYVRDQKLPLDLELKTLPVEMSKYFHTVLRNRLIDAWQKELKKQELVSFEAEGEAAEKLADTHVKAAGTAMDFWEQMRTQNPDLVANLDFEMAFYLYVINNYMSDKQRQVIDAFASGDKKLIAETREKLGSDNYYQMKHRLFAEGRFHAIAIEVGDELLKTGGYRLFPGASKMGLRQLLKVLRKQLRDIRQRMSSQTTRK